VKEDHVTREQHNSLSRRERQIMDIVYEKGRATAACVLRRLPDPPSYSAVRAILRILEEKGHLRHYQDGPRYVFEPTVSRKRARESALERIVRTFFNGSTEEAVAALLDMSSPNLSDEELRRLGELIEQAKKEGR
jgi:predicted transcriptional regulator